MHRLGIPQDWIAKRLGAIQKTISNYLEKMPELAYFLKADLSKGFNVSQVAQKLGWTERSGLWPYWKNRATTLFIYF